MIKKYIKTIIILMFLFAIIRFPFNYYFIRFNEPIAALEFNKNKIDHIIETIVIDHVYIYFYQNEDDQSIGFDYLIKDDRGYRIPNNHTSKIYTNEQFTIFDFEDMSGQHIIVLSDEIDGKKEFTIIDSMGTQFKRVKIEKENYELIYYVGVVDKMEKDYKLYVDSNEMKLAFKWWFVFRY